jgi:hypothetical protein
MEVLQMNWEPIETAPKDGTKILLVQDETVGVGRWEDTSCEVRELVEDTGKRQVYEWVLKVSGYWEAENDGLYSPTHWMPLPTPPKTTP